MIGVIDVFRLVPAHRGVLADDDVWLEAANLPHDRPPQIEIRLQVTVGILEKDDVLSTEKARRLSLLRLSRGHQFLRGHLQIVASLVSRSQQHVNDLVAFIGPASNRSGAAKLRVVWMRHDDGDFLRTLGFVAGVGGIQCRL